MTSLVSVPSLVPESQSTEKKHVIFITSYLGRFNGRDYKERGGIYGSELACINVATRLAKWYKVTVFVTDDCDLVEDDVRYVNWGRYEQVCNERKPDICVVSRFINFFVYNTNYAKQTYIWSHDTFLHPLFQKTAFPEGGVHLLRNLLPVIDKIVCVGEAQRDYFYIERAKIPANKVCVIPNGITIKPSMSSLSKLVSQKKKNSFVFCSSPDRFLSILLKFFPAITSLLPDATLDIYYADIPDDCKVLAKDQPNVFCRGKVSQEKMVEILCKTEYWVYPTKFFETCCTVSYETAYAGCIRITSEIGALKENVKDIGITIPGDPDSPAFKETLLNTLEYLTNNPDAKLRVLERQHRWATEQTWDNRALTWKQLFEEGHTNYVNKNSYVNYMHVDLPFLGKREQKQGEEKQETQTASLPPPFNINPYHSVEIAKNPSITPGERRKLFAPILSKNAQADVEGPITVQKWPYAYATLHSEWYKLMKEFLTTHYEFLGLLQYGDVSPKFRKLYESIIDEIHKRGANPIDCVLVKGTELCEKSFVFGKDCDKSQLVSRTSIVLTREGVTKVLEYVEANGYTDYLWNICHDIFGKRKLVTDKNFLTVKLFANTNYYKPFIDLPFKIGCAIMMKDEERLIGLSLRSTIDFVDAYIFYDTGSTDRTIEICKEFCEKNGVPMYLKSGEFVDFSVSRNVLLRFADNKANYLLLLDSGDELRGGYNMWQTIIESTSKKEKMAGFYCTQNWTVGGGKGIEYKNIRFVKTGMEWHYEYPVHEYITCPKCSNETVSEMKVTVYQDRTLDQGKSKKRWERDRAVLLAELRKRPNDPRVVFYLGQTYRCLENYDSAASNFFKRIDMNNGFHDENQQAFIELYCMSKFIPERIPKERALELLRTLWNRYKRGEAAFYLSKEYMIARDFKQGYEWAKTCCELPYPEHVKLWVDKKIYNHHRWQVLAICASQLTQETVPSSGAKTPPPGLEEPIRESSTTSSLDDVRQIGFRALKIAMNDEPQDQTNHTVAREYEKFGLKL